MTHWANHAFISRTSLKKLVKFGAGEVSKNSKQKAIRNSNRIASVAKIFKWGIYFSIEL